MNNDWIIDVLRDLKKFSASNQLDCLAEQLDDTIMIAISELATNLQFTKVMAVDFDQTNRHARSAHFNENA